MSQLNSLLISSPLIDRTALVSLTERENEPGRSGLFLFENCKVKTLFSMSNFSIRRRSRGRLTESLAPGGVKRTWAMTRVVQVPD